MTLTAAPIAERSAAQAALVQRAHALIPGGTTNAVVPPADLQFVVARGEGPHLYDVDGRPFLDFLLGGGSLILGHAHPRIVERLRASLELGTHHLELHRRTIELAERLVQYVPCAEMVRFSSTGSEATFHTLRLARAVTGRRGIIKFDGAYHGHHDLAVWSFERSSTACPTGTSESAGVQHDVGADVVVLPYNDPQAIRRVMRAQPERFAAVICEPMQRALPPEPGFLESLRELCDETCTALIFDEVVTGFRFGVGGGQDRYGVVPDLAAFGKALSGGLPLAAVVGRRAYMEHLDLGSDPSSRSFHCGSFNGHLHAVESAHVTLDILVDEGGITRLLELGEIAREKLRRAFADHRIEACVAGDGPIFQPYFTSQRVIDNAGIRASDLSFSDALHRQLRRAGVYKSDAKGYLCLAHDESHLDGLVAAVEWSLNELR